MANYKKIVDVDVLAEASESTNVLVEENGSLKKVPASAVGGGGNGFVATVVDGVCTTNMTFAEVVDLFDSNELTDGILAVRSDYETYLYHAYKFTNYGDMVYFAFIDRNSAYHYVNMYLDGSVEYQAPSNA